MTTSLEILRRAKALVERGWWTGTLCLSANGDKHLDPKAPGIVGWCPIGAIYACSDDADDTIYYLADKSPELVGALAAFHACIPRQYQRSRQLTLSEITNFNDELPHNRHVKAALPVPSEIVECFDSAIALLDRR